MTQWSGISAIQGPCGEPARNSSVGSGSSKAATTRRQARHKSSLWPKHTGDLLDGSSGVLNIHECHVADDQVKRAIFQHLQAGCVSHMVGDTQWLLRLSCTSTLNKRRIGIHTGEDGSLPCKTATQVAVAASEV